MTIRLTAINRYPVKSCRGESMQSAVVEPWGLRGDRRWMIVDADCDAITAREVHDLLLVRPRIEADGGLALSAPGMPDLVVRQPRSEAVPVTVWGDTVLARPAGDEADSWIGRVAGTAARLVYLDDPTQRPTDTGPDDVVSFADGYPLLLATEESLAALNDWVAEGPRSDEGPLPMQRFRPNLVVRGAPAWAEDTWRTIRVGAATFRMVKGCERCVLTTLDPDTGVGQKEPIATLARHRRWDRKTWFAVNLVPDNQGVGTDFAVGIDVGDELEVLSADASADGPLR